MSDNPLFRKAALDKLASPERLDILMQVTSPQGWIALWTIGGILILALFWSIFYSIPERIDGQGILIRGGSLREVRSSGDGTLTSLGIKVNDIVEADHLIGEMAAQMGTEEAVHAAELKLEQAQRELAMASGEDQATIVGNRSLITSVRAQLANVETALAAKRDLLAKGLITAARVQADEQTALGLRGQLNSLESSIGAVQQKIRARSTAVETATAELGRAQTKSTAVTQVRTTVGGRVVEVKKSVGDRVANGEVLAIIEPPSSILEPVVYVSSINGKRIKPTMEAQISPTTIRREEFGFIKGDVQSVGSYAVTPEGVQAVVANSALAKELIGTQSKLEVRIKLRLAPTASGLEWSTSGGPPFKIDSGERLNVSFVVDRKPPIAYVLPFLKSSMGGS
jgi:HlyD family secretion protein